MSTNDSQAQTTECRVYTKRSQYINIVLENLFQATVDTDAIANCAA